MLRKLMAIGVRKACFNAVLSRELYVQLPEGADTPGQCALLSQVPIWHDGVWAVVRRMRTARPW